MDILSQLTLLYAEDEISTQQEYEEYFTSIFKRVRVADDGQQAIAIYNEIKPDVVILDINMPILSGLEVSKLIRIDDVKTKIILLTARGDKEALLEAIDIEVSSYLEKPVSRSKLQTALDKIRDTVLDTSIKLWEESGHTYFWNPYQREVYKDEEIIVLTKSERLLMELLINSDKSLTYQDIHMAVWKDDFHKDLNESAIKTLIK